MRDASVEILGQQQL